MIDFFSVKNELDVYCDVKSVLIRGNVNRATPFFSIIIPTYNRAQEIRFSIQSALSQEFDDYEIIILENGIGESGISCEKIVAEFEDERILYYRNERNIGICGNWNRASVLARGKYIVMLHDDDMLDKTYLNVVYNLIQKKRNVNLVGTNSKVFSGKGAYDFQNENATRTPSHIRYERLTPEDVFFGHCIGIVGMTYNKEAFISYGGFKEQVLPNSDTVFITNMADIGRAYFIKANYCLAAYRQDGNASLQEGALNKLIAYTHMLRGQIANKSILAWIGTLGAKQHLMAYIKGGEKYWNRTLEYEEIFKMCGYQDSEIKLTDKFFYIFAMLSYTLKRLCKLTNTL